MGFAKDVMDVLNEAVHKEGNAAKLASAVGLNPPTLTRWLTGVRDPTLANLALIMDHLGVTLSVASTQNAPNEMTCPELEAECARLRRIVAEQEIRLDELRALLRPIAQSSRQAETPAERKAAG